MSPLVVLTIVLVAVSATPNEANQEAIKNSVSKVGEINPVKLIVIFWAGHLRVHLKMYLAHNYQVEMWANMSLMG